MSESALGIPVSVEMSELGDNLNTSIALSLLIGMYTIIYFETIYVYFIKNPSKYHPVPIAITVLYLSSIAQTAFQWYLTKWQFVNNGETRDSIFIALSDSPGWLLIGLNVSNTITFVIADGLLIWRCFHVWDRSFRIIALSVVLLLAETALFCAEISFNAKFSNQNVTRSLAAVINAVLSAAFFMSFATTLVTTLLIAYRIYTVTKREGLSSRRFKHVMDIVVQSGAVYALSQFIAAMVGVVPGSDTLNPSNIAFDDYGQLFNFAIAGISTTVMVARVALLAADTTYPSSSVHLSGLQFGGPGRSTHHTTGNDALNITRSAGRDSNPKPPSDGQAISEEKGPKSEV